MAAGSLTATRPIRTLRLLQADGSTVSVPLSDLSSLSAGKEDICPAHFSQSRRASRAMMATSPDGLGEFGTPSRGVLPSLGAPIIPIVMVEFSDVAFQASTTPSVHVPMAVCATNIGRKATAVLPLTSKWWGKCAFRVLALTMAPTAQ